MSDSILEQYTSGLTEEEQRASEEIYNDYIGGTGDYKGHGAMTDEQIMERVFHGDAKKVQERMKEVDDLHVRMTPGGKFNVSRYSEERELKEKEELMELKRQNEELKNSFEELKNLIIEKLK